MVRAALLCGVLASFATPLMPAWRQAQAPDGAVVAALVAALRPLLPFPDAREDGTPADGSTDAVWAVRWPGADETRVEVMANPLNADNRRRALDAERQIQAAAMRAQERSQADYERALRDFARTGRTETIREISLRDDGVAGDRYDAESQLTIEAMAVDGAMHLPVEGRLSPAAAADALGPGITLMRVPAHVYDEAGPDEPVSFPRFAPEQAWLVMGPATASAVAPPADTADTVGAPGPMLVVEQTDNANAAVVVVLVGNGVLLERMVETADWNSVAAALRR